MAINLKNLSLREIDTGRPKLSLLDPVTNKRHEKHSYLYKKFYSRFIRFMRLFVPLIAIGIVGIVMIWPNMDNTFAPIPKETVMPQSVSKNELLNPRFESLDNKKQPFTITAIRAVQSAEDSEIITLEKPMADITLKNQTWLSVEAQEGIYRQHDEKLILKGNVKLFHDQGYEMETEELIIDMKANKAWSNTPISGQGPAGTLQANGGMTLDLDKGQLIFNGRVKLVLNRKIKGLK